MFSGKVLLAGTCFFVAMNAITAFVLLVGAKRLNIDAIEDSLRQTYRALLRRTQIDIRLSDVQQFALIGPNGQSTTAPFGTSPETPKTKEKHLLQAQFDDRAPVVLFERSGALGHDVGRILLAWRDNNGRRF